MDLIAASILTGVFLGLLILLWRVSCKTESEMKKALAVLVLLLGVENVLIGPFVNYGNQIKLVFDIMWWIVPAFLVNRAVIFFIFAHIERKLGTYIPGIIPKFVSAIIYTLAVFGIIAFVFDEKITSLLATSGLAAMIIGMAIQINISNIFSGIVINMEHPFRIGDWVQFANHEEGKIIDINWRSTRLLTRKGNILSIPNSQAAESVCRNYSRPYDAIWGWFTVHILPEYDPEQVLVVLNKAVGLALSIHKELAPGAVYMGMTEWSNDFMVMYCYQDYENKLSTDEEVRKKVWYHLQHAGITPALQKTKIQMFNGQKDTEVMSLSVFQLLSEVDVFKPLSKTDLGQIARKVKPAYFTEGAIVARQNDPGGAMFVVLEGELMVRMKTENDEAVEVKRLGPKDVFGKRSAFAGESYYADLVAVTPSITLKITKNDIEPILKQSEGRPIKERKKK